MNNELSYEQVAKMSEELKELLENHMLENPETAGPFIKRAQQIKQCIESMGLLVEWKANLNPETFQLLIEVNILKPKDNMSLEEQKIYDEWLFKKAGISLD